uniref:Uncharacterized protein n=1 Tax=Oryza brachyantha TaxID=4533 RepID=J3KUC0_ORYBR
MCAYHNSDTVSANAAHAPHDAAPGEAIACFHHTLPASMATASSAAHQAAVAAMTPFPGMKDSSAQRRMAMRQQRPSSNEVNDDDIEVALSLARVIQLALFGCLYHLKEITSLWNCAAWNFVKKFTFEIIPLKNFRKNLKRLERLRLRRETTAP